MTTLATWLDEQTPTDLPDALPVFEQQWSSRNLEDVTRIASAFGLAGEPQDLRDSYVIASDAKVLVAHQKGPLFAFYDTSKLDNPEYRPEGLPTAEEAAQAALEFLEGHDWLPRHAMVEQVEPRHFEQINRRDTARQVHVNHNCVDLRLSVGPLTAYGPGAKVKVMLGADNDVIGLMHAVPELKEVGEVRLIPRRDLHSMLAAKLGLPLKDIEVRGDRLAYVVDSALSGSRLVHPAYILTLATKTPTRSRNLTTVESLTHPIPASDAAPVLVIEAPRDPIEMPPNSPLRITCKVAGGTAPYAIDWESNVDGRLGRGPRLEVARLSTAHRDRKVVSHTITATVTDAKGAQDSHSVLVRVQPDGPVPRGGSPAQPTEPDDPLVGVEWCNLYNGAPNLANISGTNASAQGFKSAIQKLPGWSASFDWGNDAAWEQDFKHATAAGGGTDTYWADNVHFAFFAGHGSPGAFYFGSQVDDHQMLATDARWGDGLLNWIVLHACNTMRANFEWDVWCDSFKGLHQMFGFHTTTEGSSPPLGSRFAFWAALPWPLAGLFNLRTAWRIACSECFDSSVECASIYANQASTDTQNDHLPGYGYVSSDPTSPSWWVYSRHSC